MKTLTELLNDLFATHHHPDGRPYTNVEVSRALDGAIHPAHLSKLRIGQIDNPARDTLVYLCRFFQVEPDYFFPELATLAVNQDQYTILRIDTIGVTVVADLVNKLYQTYRRPDGREYTDRDVSRGVGNALHSSYLGKLRNGQIENPTKETMRQLCTFFRVPPSYFFPELRDDTELLESLDTSNPDVVKSLARLLKLRSP